MSSPAFATIGHDRAIELLLNSLGQGRLSHAYLLVGPRQVGKMTFALDIARAANCESDEKPCGQCRPCRRIAAGKHADIKVVSLIPADPQAKNRRRTEIARDDIKELIDFAALPPFEGRTKVFIIDGAERLSVEAANTLLKTLEEPPPNVLFILLAAREQAVLPTIISRCQRIELRPVSPAIIEKHLVEKTGTPPEKARLIARLSGGSPGWAIEAASGDAELERRKQDMDSLVEIPPMDFGKRFALAADWAKRFEQSRDDIDRLLGQWLGWWRDVLVTCGGFPSGINNIDYCEQIAAHASQFTLADAAQAAEAVRGAMEHLALNANPRLTLEFLMLSVPRSYVPASTGATGRTR